MKYPRVLIINAEPFNLGLSASSITMNNFFKDWPKDSIALVYSSYRQPDFRICCNYWSFPPIRLFHNTGCQVSKATSHVRGNKSIGTSIIKLTSPLIRSDIKRDVGSLLDIRPFQITAQFVKWLRDFSPNVVYSWLGNNSIMRLIKFVCEDQKILFVPHFMDDWLTTNSKRLWMSYFLSRIYNKNFTCLLKHCREGIAISDVMAKKYSSRYGIRMSAVANGIEDNLIYELQKGVSEYKPSKWLFRFSLLGRLGYSRIELLKKFTKAIQRIGAIQKKIVLSIYTSSHISNRLLGQHGNLVIQKKIPPVDHQLRLLQRETDCILYLDDFNKMARRYFSLSFSAKIPLCLSLGRSILTIGPSDVNSVNYLKQCNVGPVVTENNIESISHAVEQIIDSDVYARQKIGKRAWGIAKNVHRAQLQRNKLYKILVRNSLPKIT